MSTSRPVSPADLRDRLAAQLIRHLVGPTGDDFAEPEELRESPGNRYFLGLLAPQKQRAASASPEFQLEDETLATAGTDDEDGEADEDGGGQAPSLLPSSFGLTFCLEPGVNTLRVSVRWASYRRQPGTVEARTESDEPPGVNLVWRRFPLTSTFDIDVPDEGEIKGLTVHPDPLPGALGVPPRVVVQGRVGVLPAHHDGFRIVTLFLINQTPVPDSLRDEAWLFQPELSVTHPAGTAVFVPRPPTTRPAADDPTLALHDRAMPELCVGLGVGVHADRSLDGQRATRLTTRVVPAFEVGQQTPRRVTEDPHLAGLELDMKALGELPTPALIKALWPLRDAYNAFIQEQQARVDKPDPLLTQHKTAAAAALDEAKRARDRIHEGIALLGGNEQAADAFRFANTAMYHQRIQTRLASARREARRQATLSAHVRSVPKPKVPTRADVDLPGNRTWYPFQLGFILLNLAGLTNLHHPDRAPGPGAMPVCDLLFFPTGGGKTEAYLGLTAYTLAIRRLQGVVEGRDGRRGLGVLMRYTLRLLTLQQFQRAAALICACEVERRKDSAKWGVEPFRIGLWVGQRTTPNKTSQSDEVLKELRNVRGAGGLGSIGIGSPAQLTSCPWCGDTLDPKANYVVDLAPAGHGRTFVYCTRVSDDPCPFTQKVAPDEGLPVIVVDEELYHRPPSLLIATVDKFAQMPWRGEIQTLFGRVAGECPRHGFQTPSLEDAQKHPPSAKHPAASTVAHLPLRPPDLIIQDELHLISGPLGTLTALYETAVDALCTWDVSGSEVRPKVIAATATIKQAKEQIRSVFTREARLFPPPGIDAGESFFARLRAPADTAAETYVPGRLYLGICAPGRRLKAALIRVYTACLAAGQSLYLEHGADADAWMTLVGYFNSLRELAGTRRLVDDDVRARLKQADRVGLARRRPPLIEEMTSRKNSRDIPDLLDLLGVPFDPAVDELRKGLPPEVARYLKRPLDVLLATNMISVGVDIERLGLMVVAGQPKSMAEYIQATSRVGRGKKSPGLVLTIYNWARPRDLSHYERFEQDHATFYQRVEPLSVTPFAPRALDRGLSAAWVAMLRLGGLDWNPNGGAGKFDPDDPRVARALAVFLRRVGIAEGTPAAKALVQDMLAKRRDEWTNEVKPKPGHGTLGFALERDGKTRGLLQELAQGGLAAAGTFACPLSLRNVEPTVRLILHDLGPDTQDSTT